MQLTEEQKQCVGEWVKEGSGLSEVQRRLASEFGVSMTYMDVRFLVLDLNLALKDKPEPKTKAPAEAPGGAVEAEDVLDLDGAAGEGGAGGVRVTVDRLMKPGTLVSGTVTFSDGVSGTWALDQFGRLALDTGSPDYRPNQEDLAAFQSELQHTLSRRGL